MLSKVLSTLGRDCRTIDREPCHCSHRVVPILYVHAEEAASLVHTSVSGTMQEEISTSQDSPSHTGQTSPWDVLNTVSQANGKTKWPSQLLQTAQCVPIHWMAWESTSHQSEAEGKSMRLCVNSSVDLHYNAGETASVNMYQRYKQAWLLILILYGVDQGLYKICIKRKTTHTAKKGLVFKIGVI